MVPPGMPAVTEGLAWRERRVGSRKEAATRVRHAVAGSEWKGRRRGRSDERGSAS
jgi:hypothetical protein